MCISPCESVRAAFQHPADRLWLLDEKRCSLMHIYLICECCSVNLVMRRGCKRRAMQIFAKTCVDNTILLDGCDVVLNYL